MPYAPGKRPPMSGRQPEVLLEISKIPKGGRIPPEPSYGRDEEFFKWCKCEKLTRVRGPNAIVQRLEVLERFLRDYENGDLTNVR